MASLEGSFKVPSGRKVDVLFHWSGLEEYFVEGPRVLSSRKSLVPAEDELTATIQEDKIEELFYHDCSEEDIAFAKAHLGPQALAPLNKAVAITEERYGSARRAYVRCSEDRAISVAFQQHMIDSSACHEVVTLPTSHSPFFSAPGELTETLSRL